MMGRRKKAGLRYPSGRLRDETPKTPEAIDRFRRRIAASMPHRRPLPADRRHLDLAESPFGALALMGIITKDQFDAGFEYRKIVARYRAVISAPRQNPAAMSLNDIRGGNIPVLSDEQAAARRQRYMRAFEAITSRWGKLIVNSVVIHDRPLQQGDLQWLTKALDELAKHFGMNTLAEKSTASSRHGIPNQIRLPK
jgi:hypothetical protein